MSLAPHDLAHPTRLVVGRATLHVVNIGDITLPLWPSVRLPADTAVRAAVAEALAGQVRVPMQDIVAATGDSVVLVDGGRYDLAPTSEYAIAGYRPPPPLAIQLGSVGIRPAHVDHVVITHRHWDHFNGLVLDGRPVFRNARHYLQRADREAVEPRLADPASIEARTFIPLEREGLLTVLDGDAEIAGGVSVIAAPGETAGHQVVRIRSAGETAWLLGDLVHHQVEFAHPEVMVTWADQASGVASRQRIFHEAAAEAAMAVASHVPGVHLFG